jgi:hypothetical protein
MSAIRFGLGAAIAFATLLAPMSARSQSAADTKAADAWVQGNLVFLGYHEVGHLLLDQVWRVDQGGDRLNAEKRADDIATWLITPDPGEEIESTEVVAAIDGWLQAADDEAAQERRHRLPDAALYPDADQRAARIACLLLGSDANEPNAFAALEPVAEGHFQVSQCRQDFLSLDRDMEGAFGDSDVVRANPVAQVRIQYDSTDPALEDARAFLINSGVFEDLRDDLVHGIGLPIQVTLRGASCGQSAPGFLYSPSRREIVACYEEVDWFLFGDNLAGSSSAQRRAASADDIGSRPRRVAPPPPPPPRSR